MAFNELNQEWQKEFNEIPVPTAKLDQALATALQATEAPTKTPRFSKFKELLRKPSRRPLLVAAALLVLSIGGYALLNRDGYDTQTNNAALPRMEEKSQLDDGQMQGAAPTAEGNESAAPAEATEKISYHYQVQQETTDLDQALTKIKGLLAEEKGFIQDSSVISFNEEDLRQADLTIRLPEAAKETFLEELDKIAKITGQQQTALNETDSYRDNDSRLKALDAEETALLGLLEKSEEMSDMLKIQERLSTIRSEKESLTLQQKTIDKDVNYATFSLSIQEISPQKEKAASPKLGTRIKNNWQRQLDFWQEAVKGLVVFLASNILYLLLLLVAGLLIYRWRKKS